MKRIHKVISFTIFMVCTLAYESASSQTAKWEDLFVGKSVDKLRGYKSKGFPKSWIVENGAVKTVTGVDNVDLISRDQYKNFELQFEWKVSVGGNSGVFFHVQEDQKDEPNNRNSPNWLRNYEMQILDDIGFDDKEPKRSAAALYDLIAPENKVLKQVGEYNTSRLLVQGDHVEHWVNERKVLEYEMNSPELKALIRTSKFKNIEDFAKNTDGYIMFQHHGQEVWYRNIRIRKL